MPNSFFRLVLLSFFIVTSTFAQEVDCQQKLDEVVVTGTRTQKRLSEVPIQTLLIRSSELQRSATINPLEALQDHVPGLVVSPNAMGNNMRIKGLSSRYILILVDGERLVSEGASGNINLNQIDINSIERIEIINGASSALYGSNAVGAVINIITKKNNQPLAIEAFTSLQNNNTRHNTLAAAVRKAKVNGRFSFFQNSSDGFGGDGKGAYAAKYADYGSSFKVNYAPTAYWSIKARARYFRHTTYNLAQSMNVTHPRTDKLTLGASMNHSTKDLKHYLKLSINADQFNDYREYEQQNNKAVKENDGLYLSGRLLDTYTPSEKVEIVAGVEYNSETLYAKKTLGPTPTEKKVYDMNAFTQVEVKIAPLSLVAGLRYSYNEQFGSSYTPKLSLMYVLKYLKIRGGIGTAYRSPSLKELYYNFNHEGMFWVYGNPTLKAEKGSYTSLSAEYTKGTLNASIGGYFNKIDDKIMSVSLIKQQGAEERHYRNVNSATLQGFDINVSYTLAKQIEMQASYSYCDARDNATKLQLESNVRHSATCAVTWHSPFTSAPFTLQIAGRVNSPRLYQNEIENQVTHKIETTYAASKSYSIWKLIASYPFHFGKHKLMMTGKVDNLFAFKDKSYINPGRQFLVSLRYQWSK